jgi:hypothetical protein
MRFHKFSQAVGGTELTRAANSCGWRETVWNHNFGASGSGCYITTGNNDAQGRRPGEICGSSYMCMAKTGYDAPTGLGTPDGIGSF